MPRPSNPLQDDRGVLRRMVEEEQAEFVALLRELSPAQWGRQSLCQGWSVRDVVVHIANHLHTGDLQRVGQVARARFSETRHVRQHVHRSTDDLVGWLAAPPVLSTPFNMRTQLAELVVHQQDVRRPLGALRLIPPERLTLLLDAAMTRAGSAAVAGARRRARRLRLVASDMRWSAGAGPEVSGPAEAIYLALNGRRQPLAELAGAGTAVLTRRLRR
jgi:uncharacterized protein (TIGR03083 family)